MNIGFLLPVNMALASRGNGIRVQAQCQAAALRRLGHHVVELSPWQHSIDDANELDVVHMFAGGFPMFGIQATRRFRALLVYAPIIDSIESSLKYRLATKAGLLFGKMYTVPGEMRRQAQSSELVIARSQQELGRLTHDMSVDPRRVEIVLNGTDPPTPVDPAPVLARHGLTAGEYCLHISMYTATRKNVVRMIQAVGPTGIPLVIAGDAETGPPLEAVRAAAAPFPNIKFLGYLDHAEKSALYAGCRVFCLPSQHEGTGLVALEAAALGAAVVITKVGGPPDYFRDLAHYTNPNDVADIRRAVEAAWKSPRTDRLAQHVRSELTWEKSAQGLVDAYRRAEDRRPR